MPKLTDGEGQISKRKEKDDDDEMTNWGKDRKD